MRVGRYLCLEMVCGRLALLCVNMITMVFYTTITITNTNTITITMALAMAIHILLRRANRISVCVCISCMCIIFICMRVRERTVALPPLRIDESGTGEVGRCGM